MLQVDPNSQPASMDREPLLSRYHDQTSTIATKSPKILSHDHDALATCDLLQRQAAVLLKVHAGEPGDETLLRTRLDDILSITTSKLYAYRYDLLPLYWRQIYVDTCILTTHLCILHSLDDAAVDVIVDKLDRALITAGGALSASWIEGTLILLEELCRRKKTKMEPRPFFSLDEPKVRPTLQPHRSIPRRKGWSLAKFEEYINAGPRPVIFTDLLDTWPALTDRPWKSPDYLLSQTFNGRRLVPVEVGRSYVDDDWGQELIPFRDMLERYVTHPTGEIGYLAQHDLFGQVPSLRRDIAIPDFCWATVPPHPTDDRKNQETLDAPKLNAWFGPAGTITPLHTDGYHNLLTQVVGTKYVRLFPPWAECMRPRGLEDGVDMSNTSAIDLGLVEGWDGDGKGDGDEAAKRELDAVESWECVLEAGETLVIPIGWWHYVRSCSVSFSVSFWWN